MREHRVIEHALGAFRRFGCVVAEGAGKPNELAELVDFFRRFANVCHDGKEEAILFAELSQSDREGFVARMVGQHDDSRATLARLDVLVRRVPWSREDRRRIAKLIDGYADALTDHIATEDDLVFPIARARLSDERLADIAERFEVFERETMGDGEHERLHALAERLIGRYAVDTAASTGP